MPHAADILATVISVPMMNALSPIDRQSVAAGRDSTIGDGESAVPRSVRSEGRLALRFARRGASSFAADAFQSGCLRARFPRHAAAKGCEAILLNTAGGLAEGDRLRQSIHWSEHSRATVTSQAAEKVYRALAEGSRVETELRLDKGAHAEWLPQETILFDRARLARECRVLLADDVSFLGIESVVFGRTAMGEIVREGHLRDCMRIYRDGRLIYADASEIGGDIDALMRRAAIGNGARAMAVIVHAADGAAALLDPVRAALEGASGLAGASAWNGLLAIRLLARDGAELRRDTLAALAVLRGGRPMPRSWSC